MKYSIIRTGHAHGASEYAGYTNNWNSASEKDERGGAEVFRKSTKTLTPPFARCRCVSLRISFTCMKISVRPIHRVLNLKTRCIHTTATVKGHLYSAIFSQLASSLSGTCHSN